MYGGPNCGMAGPVYNMAVPNANPNIRMNFNVNGQLPANHANNTYWVSPVELVWHPQPHPSRMMPQQMMGPRMTVNEALATTGYHDCPKNLKRLALEATILGSPRVSIDQVEGHKTKDQTKKVHGELLGPVRW